MNRITDLSHDELELLYDKILITHSKTTKKRKKGMFSKFIVSFVILLNVGFTLAVLYIFLRTGNEPMALIGCFFGFTTAELWSLSKIKRDKTKQFNDESGL